MKFVMSLLLVVCGLGLLAADSYWHLGMPRELAMASGALLGAGVILLLHETPKKKSVAPSGLAILLEDLPDGVYEARMPVDICPGESHGAVVARADKRVESPEDLCLVYSSQRIPKRFKLGQPSERFVLPLPEPVQVKPEQVHVDVSI